MDIFARIEQQNREQEVAGPDMDYRVTRLAAPSGAHERLAAHEHALAAELRGSGGSGGMVQSVRLTEAQLRSQDAELDRQLELERSLSRGEATGNLGGATGRAGARGGPRGGSATRKLQMPPAPEQKENRGKIPLLPPNTGGSRAPSASGRSVANSVTPSERLRRPVHYSRQMQSQAAAVSTQIGDFLNPAEGIRGEMRRAGVEPKNHLAEQRRLLHNMAAQKRETAEQAEYEASEKSRKNERIRESGLQQAQQQLDRMQLGYDDAQAAPQARVPSAGRRSATVRPPPTGQEGGQWGTGPEAKPRPHAPGAMPAYLNQRKAQWAAESEAERMRARMEAECPPGLRLVAHDEKVRILEKLSEERLKATQELQAMPFVIKTNASQQKKDRLEARLEQIDGAEKEYMKEKVFVPSDM